MINRRRISETRMKTLATSAVYSWNESLPMTGTRGMVIESMQVFTELWATVGGKEKEAARGRVHGETCDIRMSRQMRCPETDSTGKLNSCVPPTWTLQSSSSSSRPCDVERYKHSTFPFRTFTSSAFRSLELVLVVQGFVLFDRVGETSRRISRYIISHNGAQ